MKATQDRQKSHVDKRGKDVEFSVRDKVFVKVSPLRKVMRFDTSGKLAPRLIGLYRVTRRAGNLHTE